MVKKILEAMDKVVGFLIVLLLAAIWIGLFYQVVMRYVFNMPPVWTEEFSMSLMIWVTFLGMGYGVRHRMHIRMNSVSKLFSRNMQKIIAVVLNMVILGVVVRVIPFSWTYFMERSTVISTTLGVSLGVVYLCVPVGYIYLIINLIWDSVRILGGDIPQ